VVAQILQLERTLESLGCGGAGGGAAGKSEGGRGGKKPTSSSDGHQQQLPLSGHKVLHFPSTASEDVAAASAVFPHEASQAVLETSYPSNLFGLDSGGKNDAGFAQKVVLTAAMDRFGFGPQSKSSSSSSSSAAAVAKEEIEGGGPNKSQQQQRSLSSSEKKKETMNSSNSSSSRYTVRSVDLSRAGVDGRATVEFVGKTNFRAEAEGEAPHSVTAVCWPHALFPNATSTSSDFSSDLLSGPNGESELLPGPNGEFSSALAGMLRSHCLGRDICLVGEKGGGKSALAKEFGRLLGYNNNSSSSSVSALPSSALSSSSLPSPSLAGTELVCCYRDMSPRDLLMRRTTDDDTGDTVWAASPLVGAARR
jgi:hypothetical protein